MVLVIFLVNESKGAKNFASYKNDTVEKNNPPFRNVASFFSDALHRFA